MSTALAPQRTVADLITEYEEKAANVEAAIEAFNQAHDALQMAGTIMGTFVEPIGSRSYLNASSIRANLLKSGWHAVLTANFLEHPATPTFDVVVMNPPFYGRHYVKHVQHALKFLKPGGTLVSILPATAHYDHGELKGEWRDLPVGSFSESGTNVPTGMLKVRA